jgi:endonuclease/exonuclease/phosphatase family metal-dependent hydrolase
MWADYYGNKGVLIVELASAYLLLTHLDANYESVRINQYKEIRSLVKRLGPKQCVVVGDFNLKLKKLSKRENEKAIDNCRKNGLKRLNGSANKPGECEKWPLDWVLIASPGKYKATEERWEPLLAPTEFPIRKGKLSTGPLVLTNSLSDHPVLYCTLRES